MRSRAMFRHDVRRDKRRSVTGLKKRTNLSQSNIISEAEKLSKYCKGYKHISEAQKILNSVYVDRLWDAYTFGKTTALHVMAQKGFPQIMKHPSAVTVKDQWDKVPLYYLIMSTSDKETNRMCRSFLKKRFSWYPIDADEVITGSTIENILNISNAAKFIFCS